MNVWYKGKCGDGARARSCSFCDFDECALMPSTTLSSPTPTLRETPTEPSPPYHVFRRDGNAHRFQASKLRTVTQGHAAPLRLRIAAILLLGKWFLLPLIDKTLLAPAVSVAERSMATKLLYPLHLARSHDIPLDPRALAKDLWSSLIVPIFQLLP